MKKETAADYRPRVPTMESRLANALGQCLGILKALPGAPPKAIADLKKVLTVVNQMEAEAQERFYR